MNRVIAVFFGVSVLIAGVATSGSSEDSQPYVYNLGGDEQLSRICVEIRNSYQCAQAIERGQLKRGVAGVSREGGKLTITLTTGKPIVFVDGEKGDTESKWYSYLDHLRAIRYHLIHEQHYEGDSFLLVHAGSGAQCHIEGVPVISPDRARFITASTDRAYGFNGVQIWRVTQAGPVLEWSFDPGAWSPRAPRWVNSTEVRVKKDILPPSVSGVFPPLQLTPPVPGEAVIRLSPDGWKIIDGSGWSLIDGRRKLDYPAGLCRWRPVEPTCTAGYHAEELDRVAKYSAVRAMSQF